MVDREMGREVLRLGSAAGMSWIESGKGERGSHGLTQAARAGWKVLLFTQAWSQPALASAIP